MSGKTIFRSLCKGDDKGAYAAVPRHPQHFTYEPPPQSPSSPRSLFSEKGSTAYEGSTIYEGDRRCPVRHVPTILVHVFVFLAYSALLSVLVIAALRKPDCDMCALYQSPAQGIVEEKAIQTTWQHTFDDDVYSGVPRPELEKAWDGLLGHSNVRLSEQEVKAVDALEDAVSLPDGGYAGTLNLFHELHCVRWLHSQIYSDVYFPSLNYTAKEDLRAHSDNCLAQLRQAALCHADVGTVTYNWDMESLTPEARGRYECSNIQPLLEWSRERSVDITRPNYIKHPVLGNVFLPKQRGRGANPNDELENVVRGGLLGAVRGVSRLMR